MSEFRQFRALQMVSREGSIASAARQLGWSAPTVDHHLGALEAEVGSPLIERGARGSSLTRVGRLLCERADEILALSERAIVDAKELSQMQSPKLRFGIFPTAASRLLPSVTHDLNRFGIEVQATLAEATQLEPLMRRRQLDAAMTYTTPGTHSALGREISATAVLDDPLLLALPRQHRLARNQVITVEQLISTQTDHWILGSTPDDVLDDQIVDIFAEHSFALEPTIRTDDFSVALGLVAAGLAVGLIPKLATHQAPEEVALRPVADPRLTREILLLTHNQPLSQADVTMWRLRHALTSAAEKIPDQ
jgi:molybdate transport repressor ModE-like protein